MKKSTFPAPAPRRSGGNDTAHRGQDQQKHLYPTETKAVSSRQAMDDPENAGGGSHAPLLRESRAQTGARKKTSRPGRPGPGARADGRAETLPPGDPDEGPSLLPGIKPVTELLLSDPATIDVVFIRKGRKGKDTDAVIDLCRRANVRFSLVDETLLEKMWRGRSQGVLARLFASGFVDCGDLLAGVVASPLPLVVALDQVQDPGNAGAIARTLYAMGGAGLLVPKHNGVYLGAAASRVAAGALEKLPVAKPANLGQSLDAAVDAGFTVYGAHSGVSPAGAECPTTSVFTLRPSFPAVLVLGSEDSGLRPGIAKRCDAFVSIPFAREFDSLNVAQAGAIIIAAFAAAMTGKQP